MPNIGTHAVFVLLAVLSYAVRVRAASLVTDELPGLGQNILLVAQSAYFGLASAVNRHTRSWKHPWGEGVVLTTQGLIIAASIFHLILIHMGSGLQGEWVLALHLALPTPLLVPTICFGTYRLFGMMNRKSMRRSTANWEQLRGNRAPYRKLNNTIAGMCINSTAFCATFYSLYQLAFREDGVMYPLFSSVVVLVLSGVLGAIPPLDNSRSPAQVPVGDKVYGDQILVPVLGWSDDTSVIVIALRSYSNELSIQRLNSHLEYTPFKRSKYKETLKTLLQTPPDATDTAAFVQDFNGKFQAAADMFSTVSYAHTLTARFGHLLYERKHMIYDSLEVFDGNSTKMRAQAMVVVNMTVNTMASHGHKIPREEYPPLQSVADLIAWAYRGRRQEAVRPRADTATTSTSAGSRATSFSQPTTMGPRRPSDRPQSVPLVSVAVELASRLDPLVLKDATGRKYDMQMLDQMVAALAPCQRHEVMFFVLLQCMALNNDSRIPQIETLAGGKDVTVYVSDHGVRVRRWSEDGRILMSLKLNHEDEWEARRLQSGYDSLAMDPEFEHTRQDTGHTFDRVSAEYVPVSWNAFWIICQHELAWMLTYMAGTIVVILFETLVRT